MRTICGVDETKRALDVNQVFQERVCDDQSCSGPKRHAASQISELVVGYYQIVLVLVPLPKERTQELHREELKRSRGGK